MAKSKAASCHKTKKAAKRAQSILWSNGMNARITKRKSGEYCVRTHGRRKKGVIRKTGQRLAGRRK